MLCEVRHFAETENVCVNSVDACVDLELGRMTYQTSYYRSVESKMYMPLKKKVHTTAPKHNWKPGMPYPCPHNWTLKATQS